MIPSTWEHPPGNLGREGVQGLWELILKRTENTLIIPWERGVQTSLLSEGMNERFP